LIYIYVLDVFASLKVLITGGTGFIGSNIANTLSSNNDNDVIALDDLSLGIPSNLCKEVKIVKGSVMDYQLILELCRGCDYVFHHAAKSSTPMFKNDPREGVDTNVMGFMNVMESSKRNNVKKVIYASSSSIYNGLQMPFKESQKIMPKTFYESSFYCREILATSYYLENGVNSIGLRYFSVYGPNEKHKGIFANNISQFLWDIKDGTSPTVYDHGLQTRDFTFVEDVVKANILAMKSEWINHGIYNIGTGVQTSFNKIIEIINGILGTQIRPTYITCPIKNYVKDTLADISLARSELGYEPEWNVEDGIKKIVVDEMELQKNKQKNTTHGIIHNS
jgi:UDP-glucose 4-epimerase